MNQRVSRALRHVACRQYALPSWRAAHRALKSEWHKVPRPKRNARMKLWMERAEFERQRLLELAQAQERALQERDADSANQS